MPISAADRQTLSRLAGTWMELAHLPVMRERGRLWTALKDLQPERPMVLFETWTVRDFLPEAELTCQTPETRRLEALLRAPIKQVELLGDDMVLDPFLRLPTPIDRGDYGVELGEHHALDGHGGDTAYGYDHPIRTPEDISRLRPRVFSADRTGADQLAEQWDDWMGGVLPVRRQGAGVHTPELTSDLFRLIGNDNLLTWPYDHPEVLRDLMAWLRDDRLRMYRWMEQQGLLTLNNDNQIVGSGSPGFTHALPGPGYNGTPRLRDTWIWVESQETSMISPRMFSEFFLPYMAEVAAMFGQVYYGCCEPVHDRWERIYKAIPHILAVSISPWCDMRRMGELLAGKVVFSRKPKPWLISGEHPDWPGMEADLDETISAAGPCLEIICRDVYQVNGDLNRMKRWVDLVRSRIGGR